MSTRHLPPERRAEIARQAALARQGGGKRGFPPCHVPDDPACPRCRQRRSERLSRARKARNPLELLERARFHLLFGSDPAFSRDPDAGDLAAAALLHQIQEGMRGTK